MWDDLDATEARELFDRYVAGHDARVASFVAAYSPPWWKRWGALDFTRESLEPAWRWVIRHRPPGVVPPAETWAERPVWVDFHPPAARHLGPELAVLSSGLGAYVAETMLRNVPGARWWLETDPEIAGFNQPTVRVGTAVWWPDGAFSRVLQAIEKQPLGYGARGDDPMRLVELYDRLTALPAEGEGASPRTIDISDGPDGSILVALDEGVAAERSELVDRFVERLSQVHGVARVWREDREVVVVEVDHGEAARVGRATADIWRELTES